MPRCSGNPYGSFLQRESRAGNVGCVDESIDIDAVNSLEEVVVLGEASDGIELAHLDLLVVNVKKVAGTIGAVGVELDLEPPDVGELARRPVERGGGLDELAPAAEKLALVGVAAGNALDELDAARVLTVLESLDRLALPGMPEPDGAIDRGLGVVKDELATRVGQIYKVASRRRFAGLHCGGWCMYNLGRLLRIDGRDGTWTTASSTAEVLKVVRRAANR